MSGLEPSGLERIIDTDVLGPVCAALLPCDLSRLLQTNKGVQGVVAASGSLDVAANALETEFPPPWVKSGEEMEGEDEEGLGSSREYNLKEFPWREQHDPRARCTAAEWQALSSQRRFAQMVPLCRRLTTDLQRAAAIFGAEYPSDFDVNPGEDEVSVHHALVYEDFGELGSGSGLDGLLG